eukprot:3900996-Rhodomonas_salina.1
MNAFKISHATGTTLDKLPRLHLTHVVQGLRPSDLGARADRATTVQVDPTRQPRGSLRLTGRWKRIPRPRGGTPRAVPQTPQ